MTRDATFSIGIVGAGGISKAHANAAKASEGAIRIAAVADVNADAAASLAKEFGGVSHDSIEAMFAAHDAAKDAGSEGQTLDGVVICTPPSVRASVIESALKRGIAVLVEKPLARNAVEAAEIVNIAATYPDTLCAVAFCHRFAPPIIEMKRRIDAGEIGRVTRFENVFAFHHPGMAKSWMSDPAVSGGGSFGDTGCHSLDLFTYLVGSPESVGAVYDHDWDGRGESSATVLVQATDGPAKGAAGMILAGWMEPERFEVAVIGTGGMMHYDYMKPNDLIIRKADGSSSTEVVETHEVRFDQQLSHFAVAARDRASVGQLATVHDGLLAAKAVDQAGKIRKII